MAANTPTPEVTSMYCIHGDKGIEMPLSTAKLADDKPHTAELSYRCPECSREILVRVNTTLLSDYMVAVVTKAKQQAAEQACQ